MAQTDEEITKVFKVRRTVLQMLKDRGYKVDDGDIDMKRENFIERFGNPINKDSLFIETERPPNPRDKIYVFFPEGSKAGVPVIRHCVQKMMSDKVFHAILIVPSPLSAPAKAFISQGTTSCSIEVFQEAELVTNITEHKLIKQYWVLSPSKKKELLEKYGVKETQLPRILVTDPVARYYGVKRGQVVKIRREDVTSKEYYTYRYAV